MKQLTCEMCGSTDLVKQDGVFVCQSCGCKYSVEEARKMMVEGVVQVEGTVKIDNTAQIENYRDLAIKAYNAGSTDEAYNYFMKVLEIDPTDYQSVFYKGMCLGWKTTLAKPRVSEAMNAFFQAVDLIPSELDTKQVIETYCSNLVGLMHAWFSLARERYWDVDDWYSSNSDIFWDYLEVAGECLGFLDDIMSVILSSDNIDLKKEAGELYCDCCHACCEHIVQWLDYSKERALFPGFSAAQKQRYLDKYDSFIFEIRKSIPDFRKVTQSGTLVMGTIDRMDPPKSIGPHNLKISKQNDQLCLKIDRDIDERVRQYKIEQENRAKAERERERAEAERRYWEENPDERNAYAKLKEDYEVKCTAYEHISSEYSAANNLCESFEEKLKEYNDKIRACNAEIESQRKKIFGKKKAQEAISAALTEIEEYTKYISATKQDLDDACTKQVAVKEQYILAQSAVERSKEACDAFLKQRGLI